MTTPTDDPKVKALIEAARDLTETCPEHIPGGRYNKIYPALAAFDPPKPKQYPPMPEWDKLTAQQMRSISEAYTRAFNMDRGDEKTFYANVRNALATAKD
jgi:hypothetical protein